LDFHFTEFSEVAPRIHQEFIAAPYPVLLLCKVTNREEKHVSPFFDGFATFASQKNLNMVLAVFDGSDKDGAPIVQIDSHGFQVSSIHMDNLGFGDNFVKLSPGGTGGKVLTVWDASQLNLAPIILSKWDDLDNQKFFIEGTGGNRFRVRAAHSDKVLDVFAASDIDGAPIVQFDFHGGDNQRWRIEP
jgi:Ricin-type beta-trefoil lectin domain-like